MPKGTRPALKSAITNAMSVNLEDYFHVNQLSQSIPRRKWASMPCRIQITTQQILSLFSQNQIRGTFFILGWVAERYPGLIREISEQGHELASLGYNHEPISNMSPHHFREDVLRAKGLIEDISGLEVLGYRAPAQSINAQSMWALSVLQEAGYLYSSSVDPHYRQGKGWPHAPRFPFTASPEGMLEIPMTTIKMGSKNIPCSGGRYFRHFPYSFSRWAIQHLNTVEKKPCIFHFHPWELDTAQPRQKGMSVPSRLSHYHNLRKMPHRLNKLFKDFAWQPVKDTYAKELDFRF